MAVKKIVSGLKIICTDKTCEWIGGIGNYSDHYKKCLGASIICNYCKIPMLKKDFEHHKSVCEQFIIKCTQCDKFALKSHIELHNKYICEYRTVACNKCDLKTSVRNISYHNTIECVDRLMFCKNCMLHINSKVFDNHNKYICEYRQVKCTQCSNNIAHKYMSPHLKYECSNRLVKCEICNKSVKYSIYEEGHLVLCKIKNDERKFVLKQKMDKKTLKRFGK